MQPYMRDSRSSINYSWNVEGWNPPSGSDSASRIVSSEWLLNVGSANGNKKAPLPQNYVHDIYRSHVGFFREENIGNTPGYNYLTSGVLAGAPQLLFETDPGAYNDCVEKLGDFIRGSVDVSIDGFQAKQTAQLAASIARMLNVVKSIASVSGFVKSRERELRLYSTKIRNRTSNRRFRWIRDPLTKKRLRVKVEIPPEAAALDAAKMVGGKWLEVHYGLIPTMQTIYDLVSGAAERAGNSLQIGRRKSNGKFVGITASKPVKRNTIEQFPQEVRQTMRTDTFRYEIGGFYTPSSSYVEQMSRLTSLNPLSIAWELLPFSFVVDWFYDIGGYLRGVETALVSSLGVFNGYLTHTRRTECSETFTTSGINPQGRRISGVTTGYSRRQVKNRSLLTAVPYPRAPKFNFDLSSGRLLNAAALLSQFLGGKRN